MRQTVTLTADAELYKAVKAMGLKPSELLDIALRAAIGATGSEDWRMVLKERVVEDQLRVIEENKRAIERQIAELRDRLKMLEELERRLRGQLEDIRLEQRLARLQKLVQRLRQMAEIHAFDEEAMMRDPNVVKVVEEVRQLKPDFELRRYLEIWRMMGGR